MRRIEQKRTDAITDARAARLTSHHHILSLIAQPGGQKPDLRGLSAAFGTFEGDEAARSVLLIDRLPVSTRHRESNIDQAGKIRTRRRGSLP